jgi:hypothetical protein
MYGSSPSFSCLKLGRCDILILREMGTVQVCTDRAREERKEELNPCGLL